MSFFASAACLESIRFCQGPHERIGQEENPEFHRSPYAGVQTLVSFDCSFRYAIVLCILLREEAEEGTRARKSKKNMKHAQAAHLDAHFSQSMCFAPGYDQGYQHQPPVYDGA